MRARIPDPCDERTFLASKLDWVRIDSATESLEFRALTAELLRIRREQIIPLIKHGFVTAERGTIQSGGLDVRWRTANGETLQIVANFAECELPMPPPVDGIDLWRSRASSANVLVPGDIVVRLYREA